MAINHGADVIILDDGLQNPDLLYDLTITVVDQQGDPPSPAPRAPNTALTRSRTSHVRPFSAHAQVVIYSPARAACQQGKKLLGTWKIHPGEQQKWENPLMGWTSTGDALSHQFNSVVNFESFLIISRSWMRCCGHQS